MTGCFVAIESILQQKQIEVSSAQENVENQRQAVPL